jgi:CheY-like chemotaxis protein
MFLLGAGRIVPTLRILVAEDEPEILRLYKLLFEAEGYHAVTTNNGGDCLEVYRNELNKTGANYLTFDLVVVDQRMPKKSGAQVAKEILAVRPTQRLLIVTAFRGHPELEDLREVQVIQKPFDPEELLKTISELLCPQKLM